MGRSARSQYNPAGRRGARPAARGGGEVALNTSSASTSSVLRGVVSASPMPTSPAYPPSPANLITSAQAHSVVPSSACGDDQTPGGQVDANNTKYLPVWELVDWRLRAVASLLLLGAALVLLSAALLPASGDTTGVWVLLGRAVAFCSVAVTLWEGWYVTRSKTLQVEPLAIFPVVAIAVLSIFCVGVPDQFIPASMFGLYALPPLLAAGWFGMRAVVVWVEGRLSSALGLIVPPGMGAETRHGKATAAGAHIVVNQVIEIQPGQVVPVDLRIEAGSVGVFERHLSPVELFRVKSEGEVLFAGSRVVSGEATGRAVTNSGDACLVRLEHLVAARVENVERAMRGGGARWAVGAAWVIASGAVLAALAQQQLGGSPAAVLGSAALVLFSGTVGGLIRLRRSFGCVLARAWAMDGFVVSDPAKLSFLARVSKVVIDPSCVESENFCRVRAFELLDDRVGRAQLCATLAALLGRCDDPVLAISADFCERVAATAGGALSLERVLELHEYPGRGVSGVVHGVEFSVGSEDFIVDRGIMLQPSELVHPESDERVLLVAIGSEVIARVWLQVGQRELLTEQGATCWPSGVQTVVTRGTQGELHGDTLLVRGRESDVLGRVHAAEVVRFDGRRFELPAAAVVALTDSLEGLPRLLVELRWYTQWLERNNRLVYGAVSCALLLSLGGIYGAILSMVGFAIILLKTASIVAVRTGRVLGRHT